MKHDVSALLAGEAVNDRPNLVVEGVEVASNSFRVVDQQGVNRLPAQTIPVQFEVANDAHCPGLAVSQETATRLYDVYAQGSRMVRPFSNFEGVMKPPVDNTSPGLRILRGEVGQLELGVTGESHDPLITVQAPQVVRPSHSSVVDDDND